jgi:hypothetical protein
MRSVAMDKRAARRWFIAAGSGALLLWIFLLVIAYSRSCQFRVFASLPTYSKMVGAYWAEPSCAFMVTLGLFGGATATQVVLLYMLHVIALKQLALPAKLRSSPRVFCCSSCKLEVHQLAAVTQMLVHAQSWAMLALLFFPVYSVRHASGKPQLVGTSRFDATHVSSTAFYVFLVVLSIALTTVCARDTIRAYGGDERRLLSAAILFSPCATIFSGLLLLAGSPMDAPLTVKYEGFAPHYEALCMLQTAAAVFILAVVVSRMEFRVELSKQ